MQSDEYVTVYGLKTCDTTRKALTMLKDAGMNVRLSDLRETPLGPESLTRFLEKFGDLLLNRKSTTWRRLPLEQRSAPIAKLLSDQPTLIKRPVVDSGSRTTLGWTKESQRTWGIGVE